MAPVGHQKAPAKKRERHAGVKHKVGQVEARASSPKPGTVLDLRNRLGLNQPGFARLLAVSVRSLATLEAGSLPSDAVARRFNELRRLTQALAEVMKKESLGKWLQTPNEAFDGLKPLEVIERGESDRIWSMIYFLRSGAAS